MESRTVQFTFTIPFGGRPADGCERSIRKQITHSLLNSLSEIHPDIHCAITGTEQDADGGLRPWREQWEGAGRHWVDRWLDGGEREAVE